MRKPPFVSFCQRPVSIFTRRGKQRVSCNTCPSCLRLISSKRVDAIQGFAKDHPYYFCYFVTLTYDNLNIPRAQIVFEDSNPSSISALQVDRFGDSQLDSSGWFMSPERFLWSINKTFERSPGKLVPLSGDVVRYIADVPVLSKRDLQLFFKRLRQQYFKDYGSTENFNYFAVGEYGPQFFRPHYHIVLFSQIDVYEWLRKNILSFWSYGFNNIKRANVGVSSYLASYICSTAGLPNYLRKSCFKPFAFHSVGFYKKLDEAVPEAIRTHDFREFDSYDISDGSASRSLLFSTAYLRWLFPKCYGYDERDPGTSFQSYTLFARSSAFFGIGNVTALAEKLLVPLGSPPKHHILYRNMLPYIFQDIDRLKAVLYTGKRFCKLIVKFLGEYTYVNARIYFDTITAFYSHCSLRQLSSFYDGQADTMVNHDIDFPLDNRVEAVSFMYDDIYPDVKAGLMLDDEYVDIIDDSGLSAAHHFNVKEGRSRLIRKSAVCFWDSFGLYPRFEPLDYSSGDVVPDAKKYYDFQYRQLYQDVKHKALNDLNRAHLCEACVT